MTPHTTGKPGWISGLFMLVIIAMLAGCAINIRPVPQPSVAVAPTQQPTPFPRALPTATSASIAATASATELLTTAALTRTYGELLPATTLSDSQFIVQYPQQGLLRQQTGELADAAVTEQNPFALLFPELATAAAPRWLKEGTRVTYRILSANVPRASDATGTGSAGYSQYDLVAMDASAAVVSSRFVLDTGDGQLTPNMVGRHLGVPGVGEYWLNPSVLANAGRVANDDLGVYQTTQTVEGKTYKVTRFEYKKDDAEYVWSFERSTGMLVFYRHALGKETDQYRQLAQMGLLNVRQMNLPWRATSAPDWAKQNARLVYKGNTIITVAGGSKTTLITSVTAQVSTRGKRWTEWQMDTSVQLQTPNHNVRVSGVQQAYDMLWLSAEAIKALKDGQTLDNDPITGAEVTVSRTGSTLILREAGTGYAANLTYDARDGMLIAMQRESQSGLVYTLIDLKLVSKP